MTPEPAYVSRVRIERLGGPERLAHLPAEEEPVAFGVHSEVAEHYGARAEGLSTPRHHVLTTSSPRRASSPACSGAC
jgi:hypothetical protein